MDFIEVMPSISIVTASFNSAGTIADCLQSVASQSRHAEHIIIDGASTDATLGIVRRIAPDARLISEPDHGIYDAMNKGIALATGDIVGILNSDDFYAGPEVLEKVAARFAASGADALFADLVYVRPENLHRVVRFYSGAGFTPDQFARGLMPPHPTFFVRRELYQRHGLFRTDFKIAADFELTARLLARHRVPYTYLPEVIIRMRTGGISTRNLRSNWILNQEIIKACALNGISTNFIRVYGKYFGKVRQLFQRPA